MKIINLDSTYSSVSETMISSVKLDFLFIVEGIYIVFIEI